MLRLWPTYTFRYFTTHLLGSRPVLNPKELHLLG